MGTTSVLSETPQQMMDVSRSMMRLTWAVTVFGAQQAAHLMTPSKMADSGKSLAVALDSVARAIEAQFGESFKSAYHMGTAFALTPLEGLPNSDLNRAMQEFAMQPVIFKPMKAMMPPMVASLTTFIPGRDAALAHQECAAKMEIMQLVQDVRDLCPPRSAPFKVVDVVGKAYALGGFPALWAVEGIGHEFVLSRRHRGQPKAEVLTSAEAAGVPDSSLTMLHAGVGLALAEEALEGLSPDSAAAALDAALRGFLDACKSSSRPGYIGCALESLGLVSQHFYGQAMVRALDKRLEGIDAALRGFLWHGAGRAVYFSPENILPGFNSPWPAVGMVERMAPHDIARDNMRAGLAWGMTMVNLRQPSVLEGFLKKHGTGFGESEGFVNGVMSSMIMRKDTTPDEPHIAALLAYEPASSELHSLWQRVVKDPVTKALDEHYPVLKKKARLGEVFRFQPLGALAS